MTHTHPPRSLGMQLCYGRSYIRRQSRMGYEKWSRRELGDDVKGPMGHGQWKDNTHKGRRGAGCAGVIALVLHSEVRLLCDSFAPPCCCLAARIDIVILSLCHQCHQCKFWIPLSIWSRRRESTGVGKLLPTSLLLKQALEGARAILNPNRLFAGFWVRRQFRHP